LSVPSGQAFLRVDPVLHSQVQRLAGVGRTAARELLVAVGDHGVTSSSSAVARYSQSTRMVCTCSATAHSVFVSWLIVSICVSEDDTTVIEPTALKSPRSIQPDATTGVPLIVVGPSSPHMIASSAAARTASPRDIRMTPCPG